MICSALVLLFSNGVFLLIVIRQYIYWHVLFVTPACYKRRGTKWQFCYLPLEFQRKGRGLGYVEHEIGHLTKFY